MKKMRFVVFLLLIIFITGCQNNNGAENFEENITTITIAGPKTLTISLKRLIRDFEEKNTGIRINYIEIQGESNKVFDTLSAPLSAKSPSVDLYLLDNIWLPIFNEKGYLTPINWLNDQTSSEFDKDALEACKFDENLIAVPYCIDLGFIFYRKDLIENPPVTWEGWLAEGEKLKKENKVKYSSVIQGKDGEEMLCTAYEFINNSENIQEGIEFYKSTLKANYASEYNNSEFMLRSFIIGESAFIRQWSTAWCDINQDDSKVRMNVGVLPLPKSKSGNQTSILGGNSIGINKYSTNQEVVKKIVKHLVSYESQMKLAIDFGILPSLSKLYDDYKVLEANEHFKYLQNGFSDYKKRKKSLDYLSVSLNSQEFLKSFLDGNIEINKFLDGFKLYLED